MQKRLALAALLMLSLVGCSTWAPPPPQPAESLVLPVAWSSANATGEPSSLVQWWQSFDDELLNQLVARSLQANTRIASAQAALRQARALRDVAAAGLQPTLSGSTSAQRGRSSGHTSNSFQAGLDASWEPDLFGGQQAQVDASNATVRGRMASLADVQVSLSAELALAYIDLRSAQARLALARDNLLSQQETLQITGWRLQAGLVTSLDVEQARAAVEQTRAQLPALQTRIDQDAHAIAVLTGQPPAALLAQLGTLGVLPRPAGTLALSLPADTLRQRPDVRAAEADLAAAWAQVQQADAARRPSFRLSGSLGLGAATLGALTSGAALASAVLAGISAPIFDGGAANASLRAQQAAYEQAQSAYKASVLAALTDVEDALVALRDDRERLVSLQAAAVSARNAAELARQRYSSGLVDFQAVLETQRSQLSTQDSVASADATVSADHVRLFKALGGGWQVAADTSGAAATKLPPT